MKDKEKQIKYIDGKIYYNGEHIGYIEFSFYEDIKALGFGNFEIIDKRKGYGTLVIKDIVRKYKDRYNLIYCFVDKDNIGAIEFYKKVGKVCFDTNDKDQHQVILYGKQDSVVLSREEYIKWLNDKEKDIKEYREIERKETAYNILDMVDCESNGQTEQITNLIRKRFSDNGVKTLSSKETAEKFAKRLINIFANAMGVCSGCVSQHDKAQNLSGRDFYLGEYKGFEIAVKEVEELAKQFGVEIKE